MKRYFQKLIIAISILVALLACGLPTPGNDKPAGAIPSDQPATQQPAPTPTTPTFEMPSARLLVGRGTDDRSLQWHIVKLPDQTVEPYSALGSDASHYDHVVTVSPDFGHLSFERVEGTESPTATLYVMDLNNGVPTKIASSNDAYVAGGGWPNWSQDGQWLSYIGDAANYKLYPFAYSLATGNLSEMQVEILSTFPGPSLSPNGDRIVYACRDCAEYGLYMIDTQGSNPRLLLKGAFTFFVWHPDGTRLYLIEDPGHIYNYDLATGSKTEIPDADYLFYPLMLSPNGKLLAYNDSKRGLAFINTEDDSILPVSFGSLSLGGYWSPDSRYIANFGDPPGRYVYILDVQTGLRAQIDLGFPDSAVYGWLP